MKDMKYAIVRPTRGLDLTGILQIALIFFARVTPTRHRIRNDDKGRAIVFGNLPGAGYLPVRKRKSLMRKAVRQLRDKQYANNTHHERSKLRPFVLRRFPFFRNDFRRSNVDKGSSYNGNHNTIHKGERLILGR
jgi:hypothetical protein